MGFYITWLLLVQIFFQKGFEIEALGWIWEHRTAEVLLRKYDYIETTKKSYIEMHKNGPLYLHIGDLSVYVVVTKCSGG